jgi:hypothetical protein
LIQYGFRNPFFTLSSLSIVTHPQAFYARAMPFFILLIFFVWLNPLAEAYPRYRQEPENSSFLKLATPTHHARLWFEATQKRKDPEARARWAKEGIARLTSWCDGKNIAPAEQVPACYYRGLLWGLWAQVGGLAYADRVRPLIQDMLWILRTDESYDQAGAHRVLAELYSRLPEFGPADLTRDLDQALHHAEKACQLAQSHLPNQDILGRVKEKRGE